MMGFLLFSYFCCVFISITLEFQVLAPLIVQRIANGKDVET
jgi:hypothetical protein